VTPVVNDVDGFTELAVKRAAGVANEMPDPVMKDGATELYVASGTTAVMVMVSFAATEE
jgi:hypothetical protein